MINDGALQPLGPGGNPLLIFMPVKGQELEGVDWRLIDFRTPTAVTSSIVGADMTATFADGNLTGSVGCNDYTATYTGGNDTSGALTIAGVQLGTKTCTTPEGVAQQEQGYAAALADRRGVRDRRQQAHAVERARPRRRAPTKPRAEPDLVGARSPEPTAKSRTSRRR